MCQFKAKDFELIDYPVCLGNISKDFSVSDIKQTGLKLDMCMIFLVNYGSIDVDNILDIHKYLIRKNNIK